MLILNYPNKYICQRWRKKINLVCYDACTGCLGYKSSGWVHQ